MRRRNEVAAVERDVGTAPPKGHYAKGAGQQRGKPGMHMSMVMIACRSQLAGLIGIGGRRIVRMGVAMFVAVMTEMGCVALRMLQRVANAHDRCVGGVQRKQGSEQEGQEETHWPNCIRWAEGRWAQCRQR